MAKAPIKDQPAPVESAAALAEAAEKAKAATAEEWAQLLADGLPVIPLRDIILFPGTVTPILLGRPQSLSAMMRAMESASQLALFALQKTASEDDVSPDTLKTIGVVGRIASSLSLPNNLSKILVESLGVAKVNKWQNLPTLILAECEPMVAAPLKEETSRRRIESTRVMFAEYLSQNPDLPRGVADLIDGLASPEEKVYGMASHLKIPVELKQLLWKKPPWKPSWT